jgi:enolase
LAVSLALSRAGAAHSNLKLYQYLRQLAYPHLTTSKYILPCPSFNLINGGKHGGNNLAMQ